MRDRLLRLSEIFDRVDKGEEMRDICTMEEFRNAIDDINYFGGMLEPQEHFDERDELFKL
jgi:hypothetical protein